VAAEVLVQAPIGVDPEELADALDAQASLSDSTACGPRWRSRIRTPGYQRVRK
jgi:hypothetical protein